MIGFLFRLALLGLVGFGGWIAGTLYPAPAEIVAQVNPAALESRAASSLRALDVDRLDALLSTERMQRISDAAVTARALAGQVIVVERSTEAEAPLADAPQGVANALSATNTAFETALTACPGMTIANGPRTDQSRRVVGFAPQVKVNEVKIAANPTHGACLSSGFGPRGGRTHRGVDYHAASGGPILAGGDGTVLEMKYRDDYGNMVLIDHGGGVYTRYAHLSTFQRGLAAGATVKAGDAIGLMGNTASYAVPIHLHYEVLTGDYANPKGSFGLTPTNVLAAPAVL